MAAKVPDASYSCEICGVEGLSDEEMRTHVLLHVGEAASCPFCDLSDVSTDEMLVHVNTTHLDYLTPENELFTFIDDDEDDSSHLSPVVSPNIPKLNGWSEKPALNSNINNNNDFGPSSSGAHGQGSPLRTQLNLNLRSRILPAPAPSPPRLECPMCAYTSPSPLELEEHINRAHFDLTSPSFPVSTLGPSPKDHHCPFCVRSFQNTPDLELHVNLEHKDILSPAKVPNYFF